MSVPYEERSLSVDASTLGNPGQMEYQGVVTGSGQKLFTSPIYPKGTNNIGEFLAIVHAIKFLEQNGWNYPIYSDSITGIAWVKNKKVNTSLEFDEETQRLHEHIKNATTYLKNTNFDYDIRKWNTKEWGESKADYDRK